MADTAVVGHRLQYGVSAIGGAAVTRRLALERCDVGKAGSEIYPDAAMRGVMGHDSESVSDGTYAVGGTFEWTPRPDELADFLLLIFGGTWSSTTLLPALITDGFKFGFDRYHKVYTYNGMKLTEATFSSGAGQQLKLSCAVEGTTDTEGNSGTFPALSLSTQAPFTHSMATLSLNSQAHYADQVQVTVRNAVLTDRFMNSQSRLELPNVDRLITVGMNVPYTTLAISDLQKIAVGGIAGSITWTNGGLSLLMEFPCLQTRPRTPGTGGKTTEVLLPLQFTARTKSGDPIAQEIKVTLDYTP